jgi:shikimate kinase
MSEPQKPIERLYLCGFMGSGKTTVGRALAARLRWRFVDTDEEVQKTAGLCIARIFSERGEDAFRRLENAVVEGVVHEPSPMVVALGGGALVRKANLVSVRSSGWLVYLQVSAETIRQRLGSGEGRPLYDPNRVGELLEARRPGYAEALTVIRTDGRTVKEIVEEILHYLSKA